MAIENIHTGHKHHVRFSQSPEATYGVKPVGTNWVNLPVLKFGLGMTPHHFEPQDNASGRQSPRAVLNRKEVKGDLSCLLYPAMVEEFFEWALDRDANGDLYSRTVQTRNPIEQRQYAGAMVDAMTIKGEEKGEVSVALGLIAKTAEETSDFSADPTYAADAAFKFQDAVVQLPDGTELTTAENFEIKVNNNLQVGPYYGDSQLIAFCKGARQEVTGSVSIPFDADAYVELMRAGTTSSLEIVLTHPTQTTDGEVTIAVARLRLTSVPIQRPVAKTVMQEINFKAELPDSGEQIEITVADKT
ncbi:MAG: phage tail tube protein [Planctomycetota bacterium]